MKTLFDFIRIRALWYAGLAGDFGKSPTVGWIAKQDSAAIGVCSGSLSKEICVAIYLFSR